MSFIRFFFSKTIVAFSWSVLFTCLVPVAHAGDSLRIITENSPPGTIVENHTLAGAGVEVVRSIQHLLNDTTEIEVLPWARGYRCSLAEPDVLLFSVARTPNREKHFLWVGPLFPVCCGFYSRASSPIHIHSLEEAKRVDRIGVYRDDVRLAFLKTKGFQNLDVTNNQDLNLRKLLRGRVDLVADSEQGIRRRLAGMGRKMDSVRLAYTFFKYDLYLAFSKGTNPAVVAAWQKAYDKLKKDGVLQRICDKWL